MTIRVREELQRKHQLEKKAVGEAAFSVSSAGDSKAAGAAAAKPKKAKKPVRC